MKRSIEDERCYLTRLKNDKHFLEFSRYQNDAHEENEADENHWATRKQREETRSRFHIASFTLPLCVSANHLRSWTKQLSSNGSNCPTYRRMYSSSIFPTAKCRWFLFSFDQTSSRRITLRMIGDLHRF